MLDHVMSVSCTCHHFASKQSTFYLRVRLSFSANLRLLVCHFIFPFFHFFLSSVICDFTRLSSAILQWFYARFICSLRFWLPFECLVIRASPLTLTVFKKGWQAFELGTLLWTYFVWPTWELTVWGSPIPFGNPPSNSGFPILRYQ
jgi:hypothetical protein